MSLAASVSLSLAPTRVLTERRVRCSQRNQFETEPAHTDTRSAAHCGLFTQTVAQQMRLGLDTRRAPPPPAWRPLSTTSQATACPAEDIVVCCVRAAATVRTVANRSGQSSALLSPAWSGCWRRPQEHIIHNSTQLSAGPFARTHNNCVQRPARHTATLLCLTCDKKSRA